ncbi:MAG: LacI family DNA-binding transcriptional regulator [bacterium]
MGRVSIKDISREVGVSVNTVSRALNDKDDISEETKRRVFEAAKRLNYTKNHLAMGLRARRTKTLAVIVPENSNPFFAEVVRGVEEVVRSKGYGLILCNTEQDSELERKAIELVVEKRVDGIVMSPTQKDEGVVEKLMEYEKPFVLVGRYFEGLDTNYVVTDNVLGAQMMAQHLVERGHRRILILNGAKEISSAKDRLRGFRMALEERGLELDESLVGFGAMDADDGYKMMGSILDARTPSEFTAVFCFSDYVAVGAMKAIKERGLAIPRDLALAGYDDIFFSSMLSPPLTTVRIPKRELGRLGGRILLRLLEGGELSETIKRVLKPELVVRESTAG